MANDWMDDEPGLDEFRAELRVARRRMRQRWVLTGLLALLVTAAAVGWKARRKPTYQASIVIRLVEASFDHDTRPPTARDITQYLYDISLSRPTLLSVIDKHGLYPERQFDPTWAVESMKDDIDIEMVANYFSPETYIENPLREARVVLSYNAPEPRTALDVVRELGVLVAERESEVRQRIAELTARAGRDAKAVLRTELMMAHREITVLNLKSDKTPLEIVQVRRLAEEIKALDDQLSTVNRTATDLALRDALEERSMGLRFEIVDNGTLPRRGLSRSEVLTLIGFVVFGLSLPVVGVGVSALDTRIYDDDSLRRLGIASLGRIAQPRGPQHPNAARGTT